MGKVSSNSYPIAFGCWARDFLRSAKWAAALDLFQANLGPFDQLDRLDHITYSAALTACGRGLQWEAAAWMIRHALHASAVGCLSLNRPSICWHGCRAEELERTPFASTQLPGEMCCEEPRVTLAKSQKRQDKLRRWMHAAEPVFGRRPANFWPPCAFRLSHGAENRSETDPRPAEESLRVVRVRWSPTALATAPALEPASGTWPSTCSLRWKLTKCSRTPSQ